MIGKFAYHTEMEIIEVNADKEINVSSIKEGYRFMKFSKTLPRKLNLLIDARESYLNFNLSHISEIAEEGIKLSGKYSMLKEAIILKHPKDTALALLISYAIKSVNYKLGVFSTREAAINWLNQ